MNRVRWQDALTALVGVWLVLMPFVLRYTLPDGARSGMITASFVMSGLIIAALALAAVASDQTWEEWPLAAAGAWVTVSPWILGFGGVAILSWSAVISGVAVLLLAFWSSADAARRGPA